MSFVSETEKTRKNLLIVSFALPLMIMAIIYAMMGVYPFGNNTLLTIDLGQQYIDFFSYYRHTILHEPSALFYSFAKGIGGDMVGLWAYYLNSPFNILLLLFPARFLPVGVTVLMLLKIASAGLSFSYLLIKKFNGHDLMVPLFSLSYALMAYTIVNQLNVMWLDGLVFLPLIVLGVEKIVDGEKGAFYSLMLAIMLVSNYYIGYMICLFIVLYFFFALAKQPQTAAMRVGQRFKFYVARTTRFAWFSLLGGGLAAFSLLPNFISLLGGKASYMRDTIDWTLKYPFQELLSKFYIGAFNFDQMPSGHPNLFVGTLAIVCFLFYFFNRQFTKKERSTALILVLIFLFSMNVNVLNKFWHGMQYPIWYPYRFSFVVSFFLLILAYRGFTQLKGVSPITTFFTMTISAVIGLYAYQKEFDFLEPVQIVITLLFFYLVLLLLILKPQNYKWMGLVLFLVTSTEMTVNAGITLSRLSYVNQDTFSVYQQGQKQVADWVNEHDEGFYRFEKNFLRTKNDSFSSGFNGITHFSSTFESSIPELFGRLGNPTGGGFLTYSNGTLLTDALFGIRYYASDQNELYWNENEDLVELLNAASLPLVQGHFRYDTFQPTFSFPFRESLSTNEYPLILKQTKPDLRDYTKLAATNQVIMYENPYSLAIAFGSSKDIAKSYLQKNQPIQSQEAILNGLMGNAGAVRYFFPEDFSSTIYQNTLLSGNSFKPILSRDNIQEKSSVKFQFQPDTNDAYYMTMGESIDHEDVNLYLNGEPYSFYDSSTQSLVYNVANQDYGKTITFEIELLEDSIALEDIQLYRLDNDAFEQTISSLQNGNMEVVEYGNTYIKGNVTIQDGQELLMTTIPYSEGWSAKVDGVPVKTKQVLNSLIGVPIEQGKHKVEFTYQAPFLIEGTVITFISGLLLIGPYVFYRWNTFKSNKKEIDRT